MSVVVLIARDLRLELRGRAWLTIPAAGDVLQLDGLERDVRIVRRRHRAGGDVELELRADHLTARELEAIGFRPDTTCAPEAMTGALGADEDTVGAELHTPRRTDMPIKACARCGRPFTPKPGSRGLCPDHARERDAAKNEHSRAHGYSAAAWKQTAAAYLRQNPRCEKCGQPATVAHHLQGLRPNEPGGLDPENLVPLCGSCHQYTHAAERRGGGA